MRALRRFTPVKPGVFTMEAKQAALLEASRLLEEAVVLIAAGGRPGLAADVAELITAVDAACLTEAYAAA